MDGQVCPHCLQEGHSLTNVLCFKTLKKWYRNMDRPSVVAGDKFHAAGERSAWLSPRFVLNGGQWRLRSVQTCQSSRSQKAGMTFCLLVGVIGPLFTHCRKSSDTIHVAGGGDYKLQYDCREEQIWFMFYRWYSNACCSSNDHEV